MKGLDAELRRRGMSLVQACKIAGISVNSAYAWNKEERSPTISTLVRFADAFGFQIVMRKSKTQHA
jgi:DNA-binding phage protein